MSTSCIAFFTAIVDMMDKGELALIGTHLLFMGKNLERMGDLTTTIAEQVLFIETGETVDNSRPRTAQVLRSAADRVTLPSARLAGRPCMTDDTRLVAASCDADGILRLTLNAPKSRQRAVRGDDERAGRRAG